MTAEDPSQKPHFHRRLAAAGKAFKDLLPALPRPGSMRTRAMLYRVYVVPALLYAVPETSGLTCHQLEPLVSAHNRLPALDHRHGQLAGRHSAPAGPDVRTGMGAPAAHA
eukprot:355434-Chlamydomonas_euryale.AAC.4